MRLTALPPPPPTPTTLMRAKFGVNSSSASSNMLCLLPAPLYSTQPAPSLDVRASRDESAHPVAHDPAPLAAALRPIAAGSRAASPGEVADRGLAFLGPSRSWSCAGASPWPTVAHKADGCARSGVRNGRKTLSLENITATYFKLEQLPGDLLHAGHTGCPTSYDNSGVKLQAPGMLPNERANCRQQLGVARASDRPRNVAPQRPLPRLPLEPGDAARRPFHVELLHQVQ